MTDLIAEIERTTHLIFARLFGQSGWVLVLNAGIHLGSDFVGDEDGDSFFSSDGLESMARPLRATPILCEKGAQAFFL